MRANGTDAAPDGMVIKAYPAAAGLPADRALPTEEERQALERNAPLTFLFCTSRSGVSLLHSLLDGHPELVQIPTYLKAFDFFAAYPALWAMTPEEAAQTFANYKPHDVLFDTRLSTWHRNRLGPDMKTAVTVDKEAFVAALVSALPRKDFSARNFVYSVMVAYAWCLGQPYQRAHTALLHIHHGDWLWPDAEIEKSALNPAPTQRGIDLLRPDKILVTIRNPVETIASYKNLVDQYELSDEEKAIYRERYLRLMIQDWIRHERVRHSGIPLKIVSLEAMRSQTQKTMSDVAEWLGLTTDHREMASPTFYGETWWGDSFSKPSNHPKPAKSIPLPKWTDPDHVFFFTAVGNLSSRHGYALPAGWKSPMIQHTFNALHRFWLHLLLKKNKNFQFLFSDRKEFLRRLSGS